MTKLQPLRVRKDTLLEILPATLVLRDFCLFDISYQKGKKSLGTVDTCIFIVQTIHSI